MEWLTDRLLWLWNHPEVTWSGAGLTALAVLAFLFKIPIAGMFRSISGRPAPQPRQDDLSVCPPRLRQGLLRRFRTDLDLRLDSLLDERTPLDLDKIISSQEVSPPRPSLRDILLEQEGCAPQLTDRSVTDIFHDSDTGEQLAVLGEPGSGKTLCLLRLQEHLLTAAEEEQKPLPVIFECSEWDGKDLLSWTARQLHLNYELKEESARQLMRDRVFLPLFDGLDELPEARQEEFVRAFNEFQQGRSLVLCCRLKEYRRLREKAALNNAVLLQDISEEKLEAYLKRSRLRSLWDLLQRSEHDGAAEESLLRLARRPLFLNIMLTLESAGKRLSGDVELRSGAKAEDRLWRLYLNCCLHDTPPARAAAAGSCGNYSKEHSLHWLGRLAEHMSAEGKVELRIEELQPSMLAGYWRFGTAYGLAYGLTLVLTLGPAVGPAFGPTGGLAARLAAGLAVGLAAGLAAGLTLGLAAGLAFGLAAGLAFGLAAGLPTGLRCINSSKIDTVEPGQALSYALRSSVCLLPLFTTVAMSVFVSVLLRAQESGFLPLQLVTMSRFYFVLAVIIVLCLVSLGTDTVLKHYLLRLCLWQENQIPLCLVRWLEDLHRRKILQRVGGSYHFIHKQLLEYLART